MGTNYGEEYNRKSMYETAREYFLDGKKVKMNKKMRKSLFEILIEDYRLEVEKEHNLLEEADKAQKDGNEEEFFDKFSISFDRRKVVLDLQRRCEITLEELKQKTDENNRMIKKSKSMRDLKKCSKEELFAYLYDLEGCRQSLISRMEGDCVNTLTYKTLDLANKAMNEIDEIIISK